MCKSISYFEEDELVLRRKCLEGGQPLAEGNRRDDVQTGVIQYLLGALKLSGHLKGALIDEGGKGVLHLLQLKTLIGLKVGV